jgi:hypothetical protein
MHNGIIDKRIIYHYSERDNKEYKHAGKTRQNTQVAYQPFVTFTALIFPFFYHILSVPFNGNQFLTTTGLRTCSHKILHLSFRQILPIAALKKLTMSHGK